MSNSKSKISTAFIGMDAKNLDSKGRISIPKVFKPLLPEEDSERVVVVMGTDGPYLEVWPAPEWENVLLKVSKLKAARAKRIMYRGYVSRAVDCKLDKQGRLVLPPLFKEHLFKDGEKSGELLWIGAGSVMELWSKKQYDSEGEDIVEQANQVMLENEEYFAE